MRAVRRLLAVAEHPGQSNLLRSSPTALLPPISLYRCILRAHRKLPKEQRVLGDLYVKSEFHAHKSVDNPIHVIGFLTEWQMYAQQIEGDAWRGVKMDRGKLDKMSNEQVVQLYELMQAIRHKSQADEPIDASKPS